MTAAQPAGAPSTAPQAAPQAASLPTGQAGWWHEYVCPVHDVELVADDEPGVHRCTYGCRLAGEPYDGAWRVLEHQRCARRLRTLAHRWLRLGHLDDRQQALDLLRGYAGLYAEALDRGWAASAQPWMLPGKLFHQALTEAIWGFAVADAVCALAGGDGRAGHGGRDLTVAVPMLQGLTGTVADARHELVVERDDLRNNYTAWLNCAGATAARALSALGEDADVDAWVLGPHGLVDHAEVAVAADGWEWEGATYYHCFVLRAYLLSLAGRDPARLPERLVATVASMLRALCDLATDDGLLPVLHDGPFRRVGALQEVVEVCVLGRALVDVPGVDRLEQGARRELAALGGGTELEDGLVPWFTGAPLPTPAGCGGARGSVWFPDAGYLVLRAPSGGLHAVVDAGPHGGSHGHLDKLSLYLYGDREAWQPAPGVPPYGSRLRREHYARTLAHPTLRVDGDDQRECTGRLVGLTRTDRHAAAVLAADDAFAGTTFRRHLYVDDDLLLDAVFAATDRPRRFDLGLRPAVGVEAVADGGLVRTTWRAVGGDAVLRGTHASTAPGARLEVVPVRGPSCDPALVVAGADWGADADRVWFVSVYRRVEPGEAHHPDTMPLHLSEDGAGRLVVGTAATAGARRLALYPAADPVPPHPIDQESLS